MKKWYLFNRETETSGDNSSNKEDQKGNSKKKHPIKRHF